MASLDNPITVTTFEPTAANHTHTIVFLHGRGDNVRNFTTALKYWRTSQGHTLAEHFPTFRWVFPEAPRRKTKLNGDIVRQWFDVWNVRDFQDQEELQVDGLRDVIPQIKNILAEEAERLSGRWDHIILAGISMGGATGLHTLLNLNIPESGGGKLAAFMGFSCRCPFIGRGLTELRQVLQLENVPDHNSVLIRTPILLEHCVDDPLVRIQNGRTTCDMLQQFGADVLWREYADGGHWFNCPAGADDVVEFLISHLSHAIDAHSKDTVDSRLADEPMDVS